MQIKIVYIDQRTIKNYNQNLQESRKGERKMAGARSSTDTDNSSQHPVTTNQFVIAARMKHMSINFIDASEWCVYTRTQNV